MRVTAQLRKGLLKHFYETMLLIIQSPFGILLLDYQTKEEKKFMLLNVLIEHLSHLDEHLLHHFLVTQNLQELVAKTY